MRIRSISRKRSHQRLGLAAVAWQDLSSHRSLLAYGFRHGVSHLLSSGAAKQGEDLLSNFAYCMARLKLENGAGALSVEQDAGALCATRDLVNPESFGLWEAFLRERSHILRRGDDLWSAEKILLQLATEHADDSPVTLAAEEWLSEGFCDWIWLKRARRVASAERSACLRVFEGHRQSITGVLLLSDDRILSWSRDRKVRIWKARTAEVLAEFEGHKGPVEGVLSLPGGRVMSWANSKITFAEQDQGHRKPRDYSLRIWDEDTGEILQELIHTGSVQGAALLANGRLLTWSMKRGWRSGIVLRIWNPDTGKAFAVQRILGPREDQVCVGGGVLLEDGRLFSWPSYSSSREAREMGLWKPETDHLLSTCKLSVHTVEGAGFLPDGKLLTWTREGLRVWTFLERVGEGAYSGEIAGAVTLSDSSLVCWEQWKGFGFGTGQEEQAGTPVVLSTQTGEVLLSLEGHTRTVTGVLKLDKGRLLSWSADTTLRIWDAKTGLILATCVGHGGPIMGARLLEDGRILSWSKDTTIRIWDDSGRLLSTLIGHKKSIQNVELLSHDRALSWSQDGTLRQWSLAEDFKPDPIAGHRAEVIGAAGLPDGRILSWGRDNILKVWNPKDLTSSVVLQGDINRVLPLSENRILMWGNDRQLVVWDVEKSEQVSTFKANRVLGAAHFGDHRVLSWGDGSSARIWDLRTGAPLDRLEGHTKARLDCQIMGERVAAWVGGLIKIWTLGTATPATISLKGHVGGVRAIPGDRILCWTPQQLVLADAINGDILVSYTGHSAFVQGATPLANSELLSWDIEGTFRTWNMSTGACKSTRKTAEIRAMYPGLWRAHILSVNPSLVQAQAAASQGPHGLSIDLPLHQYVAWGGDADWRVRLLLSNGTMVAIGGDQLAFLELHRGNLRVSLEEAELRQ